MKKEAKLVLYFIAVGSSSVLALVTFANAEYLSKNTFQEFKYGIEKSIYQELKEIKKELRYIRRELPASPGSES